MGKICYVCQNCGNTTSRWFGKCAACGNWDSIIGDEVSVHRTKLLAAGELSIKSLSFTDVVLPPRFSTQIEELDRVFGGGLVQGASILIGGEPGIGKSTLLLQVVAMLAKNFAECLYVSGEESVEQVQLRAQRLQISEPRVKLLSTSSLHDVITAIKQNGDIKFLVIDSIQTIYNPELSSAPGTVMQVRACTQELINLTKSRNIILLVLGHVTKDGQIAGPKTLEHMVDTVLSFEGDNGNQFRILRTIKNRFGAANEIGVFEMSSTGLHPVDNPSALFLMGDSERCVPGSAVFAGVEGSRPLLIEVQALISRTNMATPRRAVVGWDINRLAMIIAVLSSRCNLFLGDKEVYLNIAGGLRINEPAADLAVAAALMSSAINLALPSASVICGEVALSGEIRKISHADLRLKEAAKLGFSRAIMPAQVTHSANNVTISEIKHIKELRKLFS